MDLPINHNEPQVMHLDLNSCFATVEQQANPLLRGRPIVVAAYTTPSGCVVAPSVEAKEYGIKVGMQVREARLLCQEVVVLPPDPHKYRAVHLQLREILRTYTPSVTPKSIDECVIDFSDSRAINRRSLVDIGGEIKARMRREIGDWMRCNIGLGTNRFLAKTAASLHKPDGLDVINHANLFDVYRSLGLLDLTGINVRYQARLNTAGIFTPLEFLAAPMQQLSKQVFHSINGYYWYMRLRGWEIDAIDFTRRSYGHSYALPKPTADKRTLSQLLMKLCEKTGRRLRRGEQTGSGIYVSCLYNDRTHWHKARLTHKVLFTTHDLYLNAQRLLNAQNEPKPVTHLAVSCFDLQSAQTEQLDLFEPDTTKKQRLATAIDVINDRYGEFVITPALMMGMQDKILDRISFGGVKDLQELYGG